MILKRKLCNWLIGGEIVSEGDIIQHSYSSDRMENPTIQNKTDKDLCPTLTTRCDCLGITVKENEELENLRIRKLTPKECWRLMGFDDEDYEKASQVNSNAQLYKQAGNSIVVNVLEEILKNIFIESDKEESRIQKLEKENALLKRIIQNIKIELSKIKEDI